MNLRPSGPESETNLRNAGGSADVPTIRVSRKGANRIESGHPWVFTSDVADRGSAQAGDAVYVLDPKSRVLGTALYSESSQITLRMFSRRPEPINAALLETRLGAALLFRKRVAGDSNAYRLVHSEADQLPGLVVDRYNDVVVLQSLTQGMDRLQPQIFSCLDRLLEPSAVVARNDASVREHENLPRSVAILRGTVAPQIEIHMNGLHLLADVIAGQKTGVYLDQRENYPAVARYARGRALDCFTSTGGFALHMASRCEFVEAVDSSTAALETASQNAARNHIMNIHLRQADVFEYLGQQARAKRRFDLVVLDPPPFSKSRSTLDGAARGYKEINQRALRLLDRGGILVSCSCSHHFSEAMLLETVAEAALDAGKTLRILERRTQSADHPILLTVPETLYLKCLIFEVV